jgi:hypothetical protein
VVRGNRPLTQSSPELARGHCPEVDFSEARRDLLRGPDADLRVLLNRFDKLHQVVERHRNTT